MSIVIREVCGQDGSLGLNVIERSELTESLYDQPDPVDPQSIMVDIEGIHEVATRNFNRYLAEGLRKSIPSWTKPYNKPMIMHHNEKDGKIIGRIKHVEMKEQHTRSGTPALLFTSNISDKEGKEQVRDGRLSTVSIGIIGHDVRCSICGHAVAEHGPCEDHDKGSVYEGQRCYWDIHEFEGKELSYVIVPSDVYASNIRIYEPKNTAQEVTEQLSTGEVLNVKEGTAVLETAGVKEEAAVDEEVKSVVTEPEALAEPEIEQKPEEGTEKKTAAEKLDDVIAELELVKQELAEAMDNLGEERILRESLEDKLEAHKMAIKEDLAEKILTLRESARRPPLDKEVLLTRSEDSLNDAVLDLEEELKSVVEAISMVESVEKLENPGITTEKDLPIVEEHRNGSNIELEEMDLKAGLASIFD